MITPSIFYRSMTLELTTVHSQVRLMGTRLAEQTAHRQEQAVEVKALLQQFSTEFDALLERVSWAEKAQKGQRFGWVGAAPFHEPLAQGYPLPPRIERVTVIASDGSQILPDQHAITLYYLVNIGSIVYRHGSGQKPETYNPKPFLNYDDLKDEQGRIISIAAVNVKRDLGELKVLVDLAGQHIRPDEPIITLIDGQLPLRVIELPFDQQQQCQSRYIDHLSTLRDYRAITAAYIDRPLSNFVINLLHVGALDPKAINEYSLRDNPYRYLTDLDLFGSVLQPSERSAIFALKAKGLEPYQAAGHGIHFFYLNVSPEPHLPLLARVEFPAWVATEPSLVDLLHATLIRQTGLIGDYPYVLARAHELAVISSEEREAVELMLAVEMRRQGLTPNPSAKQKHKNLLELR